MKIQPQLFKSLRLNSFIRGLICRMDAGVVRLRELFQGLVPGFGLLHAKVCFVLMQGEIKTAKQLAVETGISHNKVYGVLKDLLKERIVVCTNTSPTNYHVKSPAKAYERLVNKKIAVLEKLPEEFEKIINAGADSQEREYVIKFGEKQTRLFDNKNKALVKEPRELKQIMQQINVYVKKLEPKKEYNFAVYR